MCEAHVRYVIRLSGEVLLPYGFLSYRVFRSGTPGPRAEPVFPQDRFGRALAHMPYRSDRPSHTPRDRRLPGRHGRSGTLPPVPERPTSSSGRRGRLSTLVSLLALVAFTLLTWQIAAGGPLRAADERLAVSMRGDAPAGAELLADLGNMTVALPVLAVAMTWTVIRTRRPGAVIRHALAMAAVPLLVSACKAWIDRPGPMEGAGYYPSGHAATTAVAFCGAAVLLSQGTRRRWPLVTAVSAAALLTLLNGMGLVWRGYHWPADVLASWCLSWLLLVSATTVGRRAFRRPGPPPPAVPDRE